MADSVVKKKKKKMIPTLNISIVQPDGDKKRTKIF